MVLQYSMYAYLSCVLRCLVEIRLDTDDPRPIGQRYEGSVLDPYYVLY